jgi:N-acetylmuramoyl-L-alanine amidase
MDRWLAAVPWPAPEPDCPPVWARAEMFRMTVPIRAIQQALKSKGHDPGPIDGIFGPKTEAALKSFQKTQNLRESGRGDAQTLSKLGVQ